MKDLAGQRFGRLVALEPTEKRVDKLVVWRCRCDCGREVEVVSSSLIKGNTKSCGCLHHDSRARDITGERFGRLVALEPTDKRVRQSIVWRCLCDCGNYHEAPLTRLTSGQVRSCGCLRAESVRKDLSGQRFGRLIAVRPMGRRNRCVLWECKCDCGNTKLVATNQLTSGKARSCGCLKRDSAAWRKKPKIAPAPTAAPALATEPATTSAASDCHARLAGRQFGKLVAVNAVGQGSDGSPLWRCLCECNNVVEVAEADLLHGVRTACDHCSAN